MAEQLLFFPGAGTSAEFWQPVGRLLKDNSNQNFLSWPGLGNETHIQNIRSLDDLVDLAVSYLKPNTRIIAQSNPIKVGILTQFQVN